MTDLGCTPKAEIRFVIRTAIKAEIRFVIRFALELYPLSHPGPLILRIHSGFFKKEIKNVISFIKMRVTNAGCISTIHTLKPDNGDKRISQGSQGVLPALKAFQSNQTQ